MIAVAGTHALRRGLRAGADAQRRPGLAAPAEPPYPSPRALLDKYELRAKKSWGQNFLGDEAVLDDIARLAAPSAGERVVELGAGLGHLTARLLARGAVVTAVERDRDMARVLRGELGDRITLLEADAARLDYAAVAGPGGRLSVVGQPALPPHLAHPLLAARPARPACRAPPSWCSARWRSGWRPSRARRTGGSSRSSCSARPTSRSSGSCRPAPSSRRRRSTRR